MMDPPRISIVVPCFNVREYIEAALGRLLKDLRNRAEVLGSVEVILVDDGSRDGSADFIADTFPDVRLLRHPVNRGKGAAVRTGMLAASGRYRFFIDADIPFDLDALEVMLRHLDVREFHLCIGSRSASPPAGAVRQSLFRRVSSFIFTQFVSRIVVTGVRDTQCGFKGFRGDVADYLFRVGRVDNFAFDVELLYLAFKNDFDIKRVPVTLISNDFSSVSVFRHGVGMLRETLLLPIRYYSGRYPLFRAGKEPSPTP